MTHNQAKKLYQTGIELLNMGKLQDAINYFREAVEADPFCLDAHLELGYILGFMENYEDALKHFEEALKCLEFVASKSENSQEIEETFPALFCKAICLFFIGDYKKSLEAFYNLRLIGENKDMWYYLGTLHLIYTGNYEEAIDCFGNAISMDENFIEAWNDLGVTYSILEDDENALLSFEEALKIYEISKSDISNALNINTGYNEAIYNLGATLADMERYEESLKYLDQTLMRDPDHFKALFYKGNVLYFMGREAEAIEYFVKALNVDKNQEELWNYLGYIQFSIGQNYEAIESFNEAIKLNNNFEEAYLNLGNVYSELGKDKQALDCFQKVKTISPEK